MKNLYLGSLALLLGLVAHAEKSSQAFPVQKIELPDLSLKGSTSTRREIPLASPANQFPSAPAQSPIISEDGFVISPNPSVDYKLLVKQPDPAVDFKLIVKDVAPALRK